jgi:hypothetical protein
VKRIATLLLLTGLALGLPGCGDRNLILTVNLLSFVDASERSQPYGPIPPGIALASSDLVTQDVDLAKGLGDAVDVESASLKVGARFENQTGSATGHLLLYIAPGDSDSAFSVPPIADIPVTLAPNDTTEIATEIASSPALAAALTQSRAKIGVRISVDTTGSLAVLQGTETLEELLAVVVTKRSL